MDQAICDCESSRCCVVSRASTETEYNRSEERADGGIRAFHRDENSVAGKLAGLPTVSMVKPLIICAVDRGYRLPFEEAFQNELAESRIHSLKVFPTNLAARSPRQYFAKLRSIVPRFDFHERFGWTDGCGWTPASASNLPD